MFSLDVSHFCVKALLFISAGLFVAGCATQSDFNTLYDYYFPKHGDFITTDYRHVFDKALFGPPPPRSFRSREQQLYYAFHGDTKALHAFFHNRDRGGRGEFGEEWDWECLLLLLRFGDDLFAEAVAHEDRATREAIGIAIDSHIDWAKHRFLKTRALYTYRYVRPNRHV